VLLLGVDYLEGESDTYVLPVTMVQGEAAVRILADSPQAAIAHLRVPGHGENALLIDAMWDPTFDQTLLQTIFNHRRVRGEQGHLASFATRTLNKVAGPRKVTLEAAPGK